MTFFLFIHHLFAKSLSLKRQDLQHEKNAQTADDEQIGFEKLKKKIS